MRKAGFTLIELMVTVAILAIISSIGFVSYSKAQSISRDFKRKSDIKKIATALELYYQSNHSYPASPNVALPDGALISTDPQPWIPGLSPNFISDLPVDPINIHTGPTGSKNNYLIYISNNSPDYNCPQSVHTWYALGTILENPSDKDSLASNPTMKWCDQTTNVTDLNLGNGQTLGGVASLIYIQVVINP